MTLILPSVLAAGWFKAPIRAFCQSSLGAYASPKRLIITQRSRMDSNPNQCAQAGPTKVLASAGLVLHAQSDTNEAICSKSYPSIAASKASRAAVRIFMFGHSQHDPCQLLAAVKGRQSLIASSVS